MLSSKVSWICTSLVRSYYGNSRIGNREVVGHGCNGSLVYKDDAHFPFPAIRFKDYSVEVQVFMQDHSFQFDSYLSPVDTFLVSDTLVLLNQCQMVATFSSALRAKEKGSWKMLTCEDKKNLYRTSFCQTFAEFQHSTGQWKFCVGWALLFVAGGLLSMVFFNFCISKPRPISLTPERRTLQLYRMLDLHVNPIDGLSSKWDYSTENWET